MHGLAAHPADAQDRDGAEPVLAPLVGRMPRPERLWADAGYAGRLADGAREEGGGELEAAAKPPGATTFVVLPKRRIAERASAWLGTCRRPAKDYEHRIAPSEALIHLARVGLMLRRRRPAR